MHARSPDPMRLGLHMAWFETRHRYTRSMLGNLWLTLQAAIFTGMVGFTFARLFASPIAEFLPMMAVAMMLWGFLSGTWLDACVAFSGSASFIKDRAIDPWVFVNRAFFKGVIQAAHVLIVPVVVCVIFQSVAPSSVLLAIPGALLFCMIVYALILPTAVLATRFRDVRPIMDSGMVLLFLMSPIMWLPKALPQENAYVLDINPVARMLDLVRGPLFQGIYDWSTVVYCLVLLVLLIALNFAARAPLKHVAFWL